jgi:hypothetical protein
MGKFMSALKATVARVGVMVRSIPGVNGVLNAVSDGWNGIYGGALDGWEACMQAADAAWDYTRDAAVHVGQDIGVARQALGKFAWNNPVSKFARNVGRFLTEDQRQVMQPNKTSKEDARNAVQKAKAANPAELAAVKAAYIKNDPELIERYVNAESVTDRNNIKAQMSPKAQAWVSELTGTDLWSMKGKTAVEISAHMSGDKIMVGVEKCEDYYVAAKPEPGAVAPKPEVPKVKTVAERSAERKAAKLAKRPGASNDVTPQVAGTVPGQAPAKSTAQQEMMQFFGPKVAKEEEVSEYSQARLPAYRPPVPRKAG